MNYIEIIRNVLKNGTPKQPTRLDNQGNVVKVENGTIGTFCEIFTHDMQEGFPLTSIRKMPWKSIRVELEGFINGITSKSWYQKRNCKFWDHWCDPEYLNRVIINSTVINALGALESIYNDKNIKDIPHQCACTIDDILALSDGLYPGPIFRYPTKEEKAFLQKKIDYLGPIYGAQWRNFGGHTGCIHNDQLRLIVDKLKSNPYDRRMVCSAWNPNMMDFMALPPCHWGWNVVVYGNKLNLIWHQRSCDLLLGVGSNIASYALLLLLLAKESGLEPGQLVGTLADCHIYENHLEAAKILCDREESQSLPTVTLLSKGIWDWTSEEQYTILSNYHPQDPVKVGSVTV